MKVMKAITLGLVSVFLVILIIIGCSLIIVPAKKEEAPRVVEDTLIETPFGSISVLREESENENNDLSSDGHFKIRLGSYEFNLGFDLNKQENEPEPETEVGFFERVATAVRNVFS